MLVMVQEVHCAANTPREVQLAVSVVDSERLSNKMLEKVAPLADTKRAELLSWLIVRFEILNPCPFKLPLKDVTGVKTVLEQSILTERV